MPVTYTLIASNTLTSSAASVTFSAIPATYTDLILKYSARSSQSGGIFDNAITGQYLSINGAPSGTSYSNTRVFTDGGTPVSDRRTDSDAVYDWHVPDADATSDTFNNAEIYIPNYTVAQNRPISIFSVAENNATAAGLLSIVGIAGLYRNTTTITSLRIYTAAGNFVSGSSFFLYGIKSS